MKSAKEDLTLKAFGKAFSSTCNLSSVREACFSSNASFIGWFSVYVCVSAICYG